MSLNLTLILGFSLGLGLALILSSALAQRTESFADRIAPQLRSSELRNNRPLETYASLPEGIYGFLLSLTGPWLEKLMRLVGQANFDSSTLERRLEQLGSGLSLAEYRVQQMLWSLAGFLLSSLFVGLAMSQGKLGLLLGLLLVLSASLCGFVARDYWLGQQIKGRQKAMLAEFPALAELLALSVTAGESALGALERVVSCSQGELAQEFQVILSATRAGTPLVTALQDFSQRTDLAPLSRFVDGLVVAIERGTPLADVLRAQAQDVRDNAKRELMETAGKKEIGMMAPVVFLILPLTVVFALFPGLSLLNFQF
ncbi:MAG: type II secretion system F family protein [Rothia sp. (in: high G+C Gram-positive bacteria)]|nr:type II secretion system F family protein [Rothia sp. (in: high G+C Gram-positive bacteria)]